MSSSLPQQDTQSSSALPDDSGSVLLDDTASQWSAAADSEEERKSALDKSMYVLLQLARVCIAVLFAARWMDAHADMLSSVKDSSDATCIASSHVFLLNISQRFQFRWFNASSWLAAEQWVKNKNSPCSKYSTFVTVLQSGHKTRPFLFLMDSSTHMALC